MWIPVTPSTHLAAVTMHHRELETFLRDRHLSASGQPQSVMRKKDFFTEMKNAIQQKENRTEQA